MAAKGDSARDYSMLEEAQPMTNISKVKTGLGVFMLVALFMFWLGYMSGTSQEHLDAAHAVHGAELPQAAPQGPLWQPILPPIFQKEPVAKGTVRRFDAYLMNQAAFDQPETKARTVAQWLVPEFIYETVGFATSHGLRHWCLNGEESQFRTAFPVSGFSQMLFFGDEFHATTTSYGNLFWARPFLGIPAPKVWTFLRVTDFYAVRKTGDGTSKVHYNFMMVDFADLLRRIGRPVLPKAPLPEGLVMTAATNDGVPAPLSVVAEGRNSTAAHHAVAGALADGWAGNSEDAKWWHRDLTFYGPGGIGRAGNAEEFQRHVLGLFRRAFADRTCDTHMLFCEGNYCGAFGTLQGRHVGTWVGQAASNRTVTVRFAMHFRIVDDLIIEGWAIFDFPGMFAQLGKDFFAAARGAH